jgi:rod shape determining protein RodA
MKAKVQIDFWLIIPVIVLLSISLTTLFSINIIFFKSQILALVIGIIAYMIFSRINIEFLKTLKIPIYILSLVFLLITFVIGVETRGAVRWIDIFGIRFQFSEILKPFLALAFATHLSEENNPDPKSFLLDVILLVPVVLLIFFQPDLGSALLYAAVGFFALFVFGFPLTWFLVLVLPVIVASPVFWLSLHEYQKQRILTFIHNNHDPLGASYNGIQSVIAVGSGSLFGKGISEGTQSLLRFLPERHTDFIFATIAEGLGFMGTTIIIIAFIILVLRMYTLFRRSGDRFSQIFLILSFGFLLLQGFVNMAMNMGLLPIVGITLPFVSFGGSSLLSNCIFLGLITSISSNSINKEVLEIK